MAPPGRARPSFLDRARRRSFFFNDGAAHLAGVIAHEVGRECRVRPSVGARQGGECRSLRRREFEVRKRCERLADGGSARSLAPEPRGKTALLLHVETPAGIANLACSPLMPIGCLRRSQPHHDKRLAHSRSLAFNVMPQGLRSDVGCQGYRLADLCGYNRFAEENRYFSRGPEKHLVQLYFVDVGLVFGAANAQRLRIW